MFKRKTVFIVGAGGSYDLGLPVGDGLKYEIAKRLSFSFKHGQQLVSGDSGIAEAMTRISQDVNGNRDISALTRAGREVATAMSQAISIDNYLHTHADDPHIIRAGKLGIASSILAAEQGSIIYGDPRSGKNLSFKDMPSIWQNTFCQMLTEQLPRSDIQNVFDNVSFITFNYDRCLEHYISNWLSTYMRMPLQEIQLLMKDLKIIHPYGQVGRLPWQVNPSDGVAFGADADGSNLPAITKQLRTFTEGSDDRAMLARMRKTISEAEQVVYLGFAYGAMNMELLKIEDDGPEKQVYGTTLGMSQQNAAAALEDIKNSLWHPMKSQVAVSYLHNTTCDDLLKDNWRALTA